MQTNCDKAIEVIGQGVFDLFPERDANGKCLNPKHQEAVDNVHKFLTCAIDGYALIQWPDSQEYMEEDWFEEEAILAMAEGMDAAYFIPIKRLI